jgi:hypothetical protein
MNNGMKALFAAGGALAAAPCSRGSLCDLIIGDSSGSAAPPRTASTSSWDIVSLRLNQSLFFDAAGGRVAA